MMTKTDTALLLLSTCLLFGCSHQAAPAPTTSQDMAAHCLDIERQLSAYNINFESTSDATQPSPTAITQAKLLQDYNDYNCKYRLKNLHEE